VSVYFYRYCDYYFKTDVQLSIARTTLRRASFALCQKLDKNAIALANRI
jgi:hypothetical protein